MLTFLIAIAALITVLMLRARVKEVEARLEGGGDGLRRLVIELEKEVVSLKRRLDAYARGTREVPAEAADQAAPAPVQPAVAQAPVAAPLPPAPAPTPVTPRPAAAVPPMPVSAPTPAAPRPLATVPPAPVSAPTPAAPNSRCGGAHGRASPAAGAATASARDVSACRASRSALVVRLGEPRRREALLVDCRHCARRRRPVLPSLLD